MIKVFKIKIGKHQTEIMDLDQVLKEMTKEGQSITDQQIGALMVEKLSKKNYIPSTVVDLYASAFVREYKKFIGEPIPEIPIEGIEIKVLGGWLSDPNRVKMMKMQN